MAPKLERRRLAQAGLAGVGLLVVGPILARSFGDGQRLAKGLNDADANGLRLPPGFTSRIVARSGQTVKGYRWHGAPDGGATFPAADGGWIYVSNSELDHGLGGAAALRFAANGDIVDAYRILDGTTHNCAGGPTPWGTWLSCEEHEGGQAWECDPTGKAKAVARPALGVFKHEAATVDLSRKQVYLTEDHPRGRFYRFTAEQRDGDRLDLERGRLEVAKVEDGKVTWLSIDDPAAKRQPTRRQRPESTAFDGGEGIWLHEDVVYFTTKGDNRVWAHDLRAQSMRVVYDAAVAPDPLLLGVDNLTVAPTGELVVAEDGGNMQLVGLTPDGKLRPLLQVHGHAKSEITGPAFDPNGQRLYFSSQRGAAGHHDAGVTYEVTGPFAG